MRHNKSKIILVIIILSWILTLNGCVSLGPRFEKIVKAPDNTGIVYIYRPAKFAGSGIVASVKVDDSLIGQLYSGGYYSYIATPGIHDFWIKGDSTDTIKLNVKPSESYYLRGEICGAFGSPRFCFEMVTPDVAEKEIGDCNLIPKGKKDGIWVAL